MGQEMFILSYLIYKDFPKWDRKCLSYHILYTRIFPNGTGKVYLIISDIQDVKNLSYTHKGPISYIQGFSQMGQEMFILSYLIYKDFAKWDRKCLSYHILYTRIFPNGTGNVYLITSYIQDVKNLSYTHKGPISYIQGFSQMGQEMFIISYLIYKDFPKWDRKCLSYHILYTRILPNGTGNVYLIISYIQDVKNLSYTHKGPISYIQGFSQMGQEMFIISYLIYKDFPKWDRKCLSYHILYTRMPNGTGNVYLIISYIQGFSQMGQEMFILSYLIYKDFAKWDRKCLSYHILYTRIFPNGTGNVYLIISDIQDVKNLSYTHKGPISYIQGFCQMVQEMFILSYLIYKDFPKWDRKCLSYHI